MARQIQGVSPTAILLTLYLLLFPIDSALGEIVGSISLNNYIAILCLLSAFAFTIPSIKLYRGRGNLVFLFFFTYQLFLILIRGQNYFSDRNVVFLFYSVMTIVLSLVEWSKKELELFKKAILVGLILAIVIIILNINVSSSGRLYLSLGRNIDQNYLVANLIFGTTLVTNSIFNESKKRKQLVLLAILIVEFVCILFLGSRGSFIGNVVIVAVLFLLGIPKDKAKRILIALPFVAAGVLFAFYNFAPDWMIERFDIFNIIADGENIRIKIWRGYLQYYADGSLFEILFGYGRGIVYAPAETHIANCAHSIYIKALVEGGLVGLGMLFALLIALLKKCISSKNYGLLALLAGYATCGIFLDLDDYRIFPLMVFVMIAFDKDRYCLTEEESYDIDHNPSL